MFWREQGINIELTFCCQRDWALFQSSILQKCILIIDMIFRIQEWKLLNHTQDSRSCFCGYFDDGDAIILWEISWFDAKKLELVPSMHADAWDHVRMGAQNNPSMIDDAQRQCELQQNVKHVQLLENYVFCRQSLPTMQVYVRFASKTCQCGWGFNE